MPSVIRGCTGINLVEETDELAVGDQPATDTALYRQQKTSDERTYTEVTIKEPVSALARQEPNRPTANV
jgi:hypothetical protein